MTTNRARSVNASRPGAHRAACLAVILGFAMVGAGCGGGATVTPDAGSEAGIGGRAGVDGGTGGQPASGGQTGSGGQMGSGGQAAGGGGQTVGGGGETGGGGQTAVGGQTGDAGGTGAAGQGSSAGRTGTAGQAGAGGRAGAAGTAGRGGAAGQNAGGAGTGGPIDGGVPTDGGAGGATAFAPCPTLGTACVIMPLGDSETDGFTPLAGGYRIELFHQMLLNRQTITFVGSLANGPTMVDNQPFPRQHEGHNGYTIAAAPAVGRLGIAELVDGSIARYRPNIILLMIGTNDIDTINDLANAPTRLAALIDRIIADAPTALLVVSTINPTRTDAENVRVDAYNRAIPALVASRAAAGKHVLLVDNHASLVADPNYKTALLADNLHPTPAGYGVNGRTWYAAIRAFIPAGP